MALHAPSPALQALAVVSHGFPLPFCLRVVVHLLWAADSQRAVHADQYLQDDRREQSACGCTACKGQAKTSAKQVGIPFTVLVSFFRFQVGDDLLRRNFVGRFFLRSRLCVPYLFLCPYSNAGDKSQATAISSSCGTSTLLRGLLTLPILSFQC